MGRRKRRARGWYDTVIDIWDGRCDEGRYLDSHTYRISEEGWVVL